MTTKHNEDEDDICPPEIQDNEREVQNDRIKQIDNYYKKIIDKYDYHTVI